MIEECDLETSKLGGLGPVEAVVPQRERGGVGGEGVIKCRSQVRIHLMYLCQNSFKYCTFLHNFLGTWPVVSRSRCVINIR